MKKSSLLVIAAVLLLATSSVTPAGAAVGNPPAQIEHFDPNGNLPSTFMLELWRTAVQK